MIAGINGDLRSLVAVKQKLTELGILSPAFVITGTTRSDLHVQRLFADAAGCIFRNEQDKGLTLLSQLNALAHDLVDVQEFDRRLWADFRKTLRQTKRERSFFGHRHELAIAATLIRQKQPFTKGESPDFLLSNGAAIECGSTRVESPGLRDRAGLESKIRQAVLKKDRMCYASAATSLFLDVSNLLYASVAVGEILDRERIRRICSQITAYGSVVVLITFFDISRRKLTRKYIRTDRVGISEPLKAYLDRFFPIGNDVSTSSFIAVREA